MIQAQHNSAFGGCSKFVSVFTTAVFACALATLPAQALAKKADELKSEKDKVSYILGHQIGNNFKKNGVEIDTKIFMSAAQEALDGKKSTISQEETQKVMTAYQKTVQEKVAKKNVELGAKNTKEGKTFLDANTKKPGVTTLASGLQYKVLTEGKGAMPKASDTVKVHYRGTLLDGTEFDSSYARKEPAEFQVGGVIKGWTEGLQLMKTGAKWQLFIPAELAYGATGAGQDIGPNATLIFEVELLEVKPEAMATAPATAPKK